MVTEIQMPRLGVTMKQGTIGKWFKKEGDKVEKGEVLFEVETEKLTKKIEAPASGIIRRIIVQEKHAVPVSATIALIGEPNEPLPEISQSLSQEPETKKEKTPITEVAKQPVGISKETRISPVARKLAQEYGINVEQIQGTGPGGRIVREDIMRAAEAFKTKPTSTTRERIEPMSTIRKVTAERLSGSHLTAAHVTIVVEADVTEMVKMRQAMLPEIEKTSGVRISFNDMIVRAVTKAIKEFPYLNATLEGDNIKIFQDVHMGVAVAIEEGLMVLVLRDADKKSLVEISRATKELSDKAKQGTISLDEVSGSTFTITNLGMFGAEIFTPIINPPESAILGVGRIIEKPVVIGGQITVRSMMYLNLSFDHRIIDGAPAAKFLQRVQQILENPYLLLT